MTYSSLASLIDRAGEVEIRQISDRERRGAIDPVTVDAALQDADNIINGYIGVKYALPLPAVPDLVRSWATSIARYVLHRNGAPENVSQDYKDAIAALKDVARGVLALPVAPGDAPPASVGGRVMAHHRDLVFTASRMRGWR
ncbi:gp436 family protein [Paracoccus sp. p3-h83]|uniref:gp436 family protein n=1 Tax=Paracoccus sp. p3-h83 TaxID=3342805 RepID=UPI0035BA0C2A